MGNIAYVDGQNLYMATARGRDPWRIDMRRFRVYLRNKYKVDEAYYFIGAFDDRHSSLYESLQRAGFILVFREHGMGLKSDKKGNVDVDLTLYALRDLIERGQEYEKALIVSGDGDYFRLVQYLIEKGRFEKMLLPCKRFASSLYKRVSRERYAYLDTPDMRALIGQKERPAS